MARYGSGRCGCHPCLCVFLVTSPIAKTQRVEWTSLRAAKAVPGVMCRSSRTNTRRIEGYTYARGRRRAVSFDPGFRPRSTNGGSSSALVVARLYFRGQRAKAAQHGCSRELRSEPPSATFDVSWYLLSEASPMNGLPQAGDRRTGLCRADCSAWGPNTNADPTHNQANCLRRRAVWRRFNSNDLRSKPIRVMV